MALKTTSKSKSKVRIKGITRIDHPPRRTYGWYVRMQIAGEKHAKFFSDLTHGGKGKALEAAKIHRVKLEKLAVSAPAPKKVVKKVVKKAAPVRKAPAKKKTAKVVRKSARR
jgi:hypothetical protein